jgi:CheY-like chemotaxis protein
MTIRLPDFLKPAPIAPATKSISHVPDGVTSVLLVDDEPAIRSLFASSLRRDGYHVVEAADGRAAIKALEAAGRVDVMVTDVHMPNMDGLTLADTLRASHPDLNVIFVSGYPVDHQAMGPHSRLLSKPFARNDLMNLVSEVAGPPQH